MTATQERQTILFEDELVQETQVRITNAGDGLSEALKIKPKVLHLGDEVAFVLRGTVTQINHRQKDDDEPIIRVHTVKAAGITEIDIPMAEKILAAAADDLAKRKAEIDGQLMLDAENEAKAKEALD